MDLTYDRLKLLGSGSFGKVYLVYDRQTDEKYALKIIPLDGEDKLEAAMQEVKAMSKVRHDGIVKLKKFYIDVHHLNILSEYCEGGDLNNFLKHQKDSGQQLLEVLIIIWISQLTRGLQHLHRQRIIHRDIKPHNIFLGDKMAAKLGDLGIAKVLETNKKSMASTFQGSFAYMAPEMLHNKPYDYKVDLWSLGCCIYEMMTLCRAFYGQSIVDVIGNIRFGELPDFKTRSRIYSRELNYLVKSMLQRDPVQRTSASDILQNSLIPEKHYDVPQKVIDLYKTREAAGECREFPIERSESSVSSNDTLTNGESSSSDMFPFPASMRRLSLQIEEEEKRKERDLVHSALQQLQSLNVSKSEGCSNGDDCREKASTRMRRDVKYSPPIDNSEKTRPKSDSETSFPSCDNSDNFHVDDCAREHLIPVDNERLKTVSSDEKQSLSKSISDEMNSSSVTKQNTGENKSKKKKKKSLLSLLTREKDKTDSPPVSGLPLQNSGELSPGADSPVMHFTGETSTLPNTDAHSHPPMYPHLSERRPSHINETNSEEETIRADMLVSSIVELPNPNVLKRQLETALGMDLLKKCLSALKFISVKDCGTIRIVLQDMMGLAKYTDYSEMLFLLVDLQNNS